MDNKLSVSSASCSAAGALSCWKDLWRVNLPSKIKLFLWKASKGWLLALQVLHRRHLQVFDCCPCCGLESESIQHALWFCNSLCEVLNHCLPSLHSAILDDANVRPAAPLGTAVSIGWKAPDEGWFKLNVDTSLRATDCLVGLWAVIHDSNGAFMADLSRKLIGLVSIEVAEAFAISNGLYLAFESSFSWLQVESGTLYVINYIIQNNSP